MSGGHRNGFDGLLIERDSGVHRLDPAVKLIALLAFVAAVAVTPRRAVPAITVLATLLGVVAVAARVPVGAVVRRVLVVGPFLLVAAMLPLIGEGERTALGPFSVSVDGSWAAWGIASKAVLGATASVLLTATTPLPDLLRGLTRLRVPRVVVSIIAFMVRYLELIVDEVGRMRMAMAARGHAPRWLWQSRAAATAVGTVFVRTYERGERVHQAMLARGFTGVMPDIAPPRRDP